MHVRQRDIYGARPFASQNACPWPTAQAAGDFKSRPSKPQLILKKRSDYIKKIKWSIPRRDSFSQTKKTKEIGAPNVTEWIVEWNVLLEAGPNIFNNDSASKKRACRCMDHSED